MIIISALGTVTERLVKGLQAFEIRRQVRPNECTEKTEKSPGDLTRLAVIQIPLNDRQLMLVRKKKSLK